MEVGNFSNTPDTANQEFLKLFDNLGIDVGVFDPEVTKLCLVTIFLFIELDGDFIDNRIVFELTDLTLYLLRLVWSNEVLG